MNQSLAPLLPVIVTFCHHLIMIVQLRMAVLPLPCNRSVRHSNLTILVNSNESAAASRLPDTYF